MKIFTALITGIALAAYVVITSQGDKNQEAQETKPVIGIIQTIEHPALDQTREGLLKTLEENGLIKDKNVTIVYESAQSNPALAVQIVQKFVGQKANIILAIATTAAQGAVKGTQGKNIPVVFASVTDPVGSKVLLNPQNPEANITGVTNYVDIERQLETFLQILPFKKLGIIYNPGEANSVTIVEKTQKLALQMNFQIITAPATKTSDVATAAQSLVGKVDAIFINNDNTALAAFDSITKIGKEHKIPVFVSDVDIIDKGALAALGADQFVLGVQMGQIAVDVLKSKKISDIPMEKPRTITLKLNHAVAKELGIKFPNKVLKNETK
jgi:putative tryptophan/tyrosine transport system substrate-binding protein